MKPRRASFRRAELGLRIQRLSHEIEKLVPEIRSTLQEEPSVGLIGAAVTGLERATAALRALLLEGGPPAREDSQIQEMLGGASSLLSSLGSRVVLVQRRKGVAKPPSMGARILAVLLEEPERQFDAIEIAGKLGCSVPVARTTLNRLVQSGHAARPAEGQFRAKG